MTRKKRRFVDFIFLDNINEIEANIEKTGAINKYAIYQSMYHLNR